MTGTAAPVARDRRFVLLCLGIGLCAGLFSGLFGVGGGTVIVPMLVLFLGFDQRRAAGASLAAIVPTATVGVISYAIADAVAWIPALLLAAGAVLGAQLGTWLLARLPQTVLRWGFIGFLGIVVVMLFVIVPEREAGLVLNVLTGVGLVAVGVVTGTLAGLLGVGGGIIVVPALIFLFGTSDILAKGTSLMMMIPTAVSGTIGNLRRHNTDLVAAALVGGAACVTTAAGALISVNINPLVGNLLFAAFVVAIAIQMAVRTLRGRRRS